MSNENGSCNMQRNDWYIYAGEYDVFQDATFKKGKGKLMGHSS